MAHVTGLPSRSLRGIARRRTRHDAGRRLIATFVMACSLISPALAQEARPEVLDTLKAERRSQPNMRATIDSRTGLPSRLRNLDVPTNLVRSLGASRDEAPTDEAVRRAVDAFFARSRLRSAFPQGNALARRVTKDVKPDPNLPNHYVATVQQEVNGIPVFGSSAKLTLNRSLAVRSLSASFSALDLVDIKDEIGEAAAIKAAQAELNNRLATRKLEKFGLDSRDDRAAIAAAQPSATKVIFDPKLLKRGLTVTTQQETRLAWQVSIDSYRVFIDAKNAQVLYFYRDHQSFTVRRIVDLGGTTTPPENGQMDIDEESSTRAATLSDDAILAYQNSGAVRDFFFGVLGRKSFDDGKTNPTKFGSAITSYVRYGSGAAAHWCVQAGHSCPNPNVAVYGPGYAGELDVVGHEFMHGVIAHEANLAYLEEAGAVNESLADIFGSLIELRTRGSGGNWLLGEGLPNFSAAAPLRSMINPGLSDADGRSLFTSSAGYDGQTNRGQPSHYLEYVHREDAICKTTSDHDNGCVHFNSGILNKFAYLISEGGEHHGVKVTGIGPAKLGAMAYRALRTKLTQTSGLQDAAFGFLDSCRDFVDAKLGQFSAEDCQQVERAQQAVGLEAPTG